MTTQSRILILDDEPEMLENLDRLLSADGYRCWTLGDPRRVKVTLREVRPDVLITDLRMPGVDGMGVLKIAQEFDSALPILLITAYASTSSAVQAIQRGAFDYLSKPFTADQLAVAVERALRHRQLAVENQTLRGQLSGGDASIVGSSPSFVRLLDQVTRVAATDANVLISGESGTGKELVARMTHTRSGRASGPFVPVDCAALPEGLLESELFGHEKGAFTGAVNQRHGLLAEADGGTIFLDEVGELTLPLQAKLLRVLEERQVRRVGSSKFIDVDVRTVAATNRDLEEEVLNKTFREDLFYRLNVVHFRVPPLRDRAGDVVLLVRRFLEEFSASAGKTPPTISEEVWKLLVDYEWPGNVRQLRNLMEQIVALDADGRVTQSDLPPRMRFGEHDDDVPGTPRLATLGGYEEAKESAMKAFRSAYISELLNASDGNVSKAARTAGVSRRTVHRWLAELDDSPQDEPGDADTD